MKLNAYLAEFIGTFILTLGVSLSLTTNFPIPTPVMAALIVGLFVYTVGSISGAHFNPAVTLALATVKKINPQNALMYILFQLMGAALAMRLAQGWEMTTLVPSNSWEVGLAEALGAFILVFGISAVVNDKVKEDAAGLVIGGSLFLGILLTSGFSYGVLNPAVAMALKTFSWMYLLGPIVGAITAAWVYKFLVKR